GARPRACSWWTPPTSRPPWSAASTTCSTPCWSCSATASSPGPRRAERGPVRRGGPGAVLPRPGRGDAARPAGGGTWRGLRPVENVIAAGARASVDCPQELPVTTPAIESTTLTKSYGGRPIVRDLTFQVNPGEVYALVGPNGAGKTTVIRLVSGLAFPTSGEVRLMGKDPHQHPEVRRSLGAVVEAPAAFYPFLTGRANLKLHADLAGGVEPGRIDEVLALMELAHAADRKVGIYSLGMRQRLGVAAAMLTRPEVLILDEPA